MGLLIAKSPSLTLDAWSPPTLSQWSRDMIYCNTQAEVYSELLPPRSRPKNFWNLYNDYLLTQTQEETTQSSPVVMP